LDLKMVNWFDRGKIEFTACNRFCQRLGLFAQRNRGLPKPVGGTISKHLARHQMLYYDIWQWHPHGINAIDTQQTADGALYGCGGELLGVGVSIYCDLPGGLASLIYFFPI